MHVRSARITITTAEAVELIDITDQLNAELRQTDVSEGCLVLFTLHTTSGICVNENEPGLLRDIRAFVENLAPPRQNYAHDAKHGPGTENAHSHLQALCIGPHVTLPVKNKQLQLGTWQSIFFVELDGPRNREVIVQIMGE